MRIDAADDSSDLTDIHNLMKIAKRTTYDQVIATVERFYPAARISPRTEFGIRQIVDDFAAREKKRTSRELPAPKKPEGRRKPR